MSETNAADSTYGSTLDWKGGNAAQPQGVCPHCGYCPHCGRGGGYSWPWYPYQPWHPGPWYGYGDYTITYQDGHTCR